MREESYIIQITMVILFIAVFTNVLNPISQLLNSSKSNMGNSNDDYTGYKNEIAQKQTEIERLNKDLSVCNNRNPIAFSMLELAFGIIIGAIIVLYWCRGHEKDLQEEIGRLKTLHEKKKK